MTELRRRPIDASAVGICLVLCFIWGMQQVAIKAASNDISPMLQVSLRSGIAAILLLLTAKFLLKEPWSPKLRWIDGFWMGLGFAGEFLFVAEGLRFTTAAHMSVLLYTAPLFAAIGLSWKIPAERLSLLQWFGVLLAFAGIATAFLLPALMHDSAVESNRIWWLGDLLGLCAGLSWGLTTIVMRTTTANEAVPSQMLFWQLSAGFFLLLPFGLFTGQDHFESTEIGWMSLIFQTFIVSFASYLVWCSLIKKYLVARLGILVFLTPLFGVLLSVVLLNESIGWPFVIGSLMVLLGIVVVQSPNWMHRE